MTITIAEWAASQRQAMVEQQLRRRGIRNPRLLSVMAAVPRHEFVSSSAWEQAYEDHPIPIGYGQTISQPYMVALMVDALELQGTEKVLEVGTGSGYQAAVLAGVARHVYTIERDPVLAEEARARLAQMGLSGSVEVITGDGSVGFREAAPYDGIIVAAAAPSVPPALFDQLTEGGRLVIPVGELDNQELRQIRKVAGQPVAQMLGYCRFVPLTGSSGWQVR